MKAKFFKTKNSQQWFIGLQFGKLPSGWDFMAHFLNFHFLLELHK